MIWIISCQPNRVHPKRPTGEHATLPERAICWLKNRRRARDRSQDLRFGNSGFGGVPSQSVESRGMTPLVYLDNGCISELTPRVGVRVAGGALAKRPQRFDALRRLATAAPSAHRSWRQLGDAPPDNDQSKRRLRAGTKMVGLRIMRTAFFAVVAASLLSSFAAAADSLHVLFIGNSYTGVNNLPQIFQQIVASTGIPAPEVKASTPGSRTLAKHLGEAETLKLIDERRWDVVVLQGQSTEAAKLEPYGSIGTNFLAGAHDLCQRIKSASPRARIVFYQTWARHADYWKAAKANTDVGKNPVEMQARNRISYQRAADENKGVVAPVGDAWELNYQSPEAVRLHDPDHSHPAFNGSYLAGMVIYGVIYHAADFAVPYRGRLDDDEAAYLQRLAATVVKTVRK